MLNLNRDIRVTCRATMQNGLTGEVRDICTSATGRVYVRSHYPYGAHVDAWLGPFTGGVNGYLALLGSAWARPRTGADVVGNVWEFEATRLFPNGAFEGYALDNVRAELRA